ncbi:hypothetical protein RA28_05110 [Ruegeria sp. ANG-S4]|nr:hypothetical protein RA28_05110 [Ruegeria sp. ANG-S4]
MRIGSNMVTGSCVQRTAENHRDAVKKASCNLVQHERKTRALRSDGASAFLARALVAPGMGVW